MHDKERKSHDGNVKIKQITQSEKVERKKEWVRLEAAAPVRIVEKGNKTATGWIQGD